MKKKTWQEKMDEAAGLPRVDTISDRMSPRWGTGTFVIPAPREVEGYMRQIPEGRLCTMDVVREKLADRHGVTIACPLTTGIFAWMAAQAAAEAASEGKTDTAPYWRLLKTKGEINAKYPGGIDNQRALLETEGHRVVQKGKKYYVQGFEAVLAEVE